MPSHYTEKYKLNQWEPEDKVLRSEFNEDNKRLENALSALAAADAAEKSAREAAVSSVSAAMNAKGNCTVSVFSYPGRGTCGRDNPTTVNFSKVPAAYIICGDNVMLGRGGASTATFVDSNGSGSGGCTWSGSALSTWHSSNPARQLNSSGVTYQVIAFYT